MNYKNHIFLLSIITTLSRTQRIRFMSTEHPVVSFYNTKYFSYANLTSRRFGRMDPVYYVGLNFHVIYSIGNNVSVSFYFYEFLSNRYRRGFVEMHFKFCDLIHNDQFFGAVMKQGKLAQPCPYPPGVYNLSNMTVPVKHIPRSFPFTNGRIYCNFTGTSSNEILAAGYIDMEIKEVRLRGNKSGKNPSTLLRFF